MMIFIGTCIWDWVTYLRDHLIRRFSCLMCMVVEEGDLKTSFGWSLFLSDLFNILLYRLLERI